MHRSSAAVSTLRRHLSIHQKYQSQLAKQVTKLPCDVFLNHRGIDTKRTIVSLLYDRLSRLNLRPFLDNKNMKPGDKLFDNIDSAIRTCKIGVAVFSPRYCDSYFCLHELALFMESNKKVIPIFFDIKPSQLKIGDNIGQCDVEKMRRFKWALEQAKNTVGLTFNSTDGPNMADVVTSAAQIVINSLTEIEDQKPSSMQIAESTNSTPFMTT